MRARPLRPDPGWRAKADDDLISEAVAPGRTQSPTGLCQGRASSMHARGLKTRRNAERSRGMDPPRGMERARRPARFLRRSCPAMLRRRNEHRPSSPPRRRQSARRGAWVMMTPLSRQTTLGQAATDRKQPRPLHRDRHEPRSTSGVREVSRRGLQVTTAKHTIRRGRAGSECWG